MKLAVAILTWGVAVVSTWGIAEGRTNGRRLRQGEPCDEAGYFGDADDCRKFYRCAEHETNVADMPLYLKFEFLCPVGTAFDEAIVTCNYPHNVQNLPPNCPTEAPALPPANEDGSVQPGDSENQSENNNQIDNGQVSASGSGQKKITVYPFPFYTAQFPFYLPVSNLVYYNKK